MKKSAMVVLITYLLFLCGWRKAELGTGGCHQHGLSIITTQLHVADNFLEEEAIIGIWCWRMPIGYFSSFLLSVDVVVVAQSFDAQEVNASPPLELHQLHHPL